MLPILVVIAAVCLHTTGDLLQRRSTRGGPGAGSGSASLIEDLFRRPSWLLGLLASVNDPSLCRVLSVLLTRSAC